MAETDFVVALDNARFLFSSG